MSVNFFEPNCQELVINQSVFGLCDNQDGTKAYTNANILDADKWIATVKNDEKINLIFTAIDKCVLKDGEKVGVKRCDGMMYSNEHLYFVELKDQKNSWISGAIEQLESTIELFKISHPEKINIFKHKKAYACNRRHTHFQVIDNEENLRFFQKHRFRLDAQAEIIVV
jgi:hypothetical protein